MFDKLNEKFKAAQQERQTLKDERARDQAERTEAAGRLVTSAVFGTASIELYEGGYVRIAEPSTDSSSVVSTITKKTPYERLVSATFTPPESEKVAASQPAPSGIEGSASQVVSAIFKGSRAAMKSTLPGLAATGVGHIAKSMTNKATLTIVTDKQIHSFTNVVSNSVGLKIPKADQIEVGRQVAAAAARILGLPEPSTAAAEPTPIATASAEPAPKTVSDRLRELAVLHAEGILGDDEFAAAKAKLLTEF